MQTVALIVQNNLTSTDSTGGAEPVRKNEGDIFMKCSKILSPMTGEAVGLGEVPDPVFSQKIVGDGMAVIPSEGKLLSPVDGEIISVADTKHAFGLRTAEGLELLIHVGLETVHLNGECFQVFVKPGDKVKAGDLLAEVDMAYLKERGINPITPVLVCGGFQGQQLNAAAGPVQAGKTVLMETAETVVTAPDHEQKTADSLETSAGTGAKEAEMVKTSASEF